MALRDDDNVFKGLLKEGCFINGQWTPADTGKTFAVASPFDGRVLAHVPHCGREETQRAIEAAHRQWESWAFLAAQERSRFLWTWAQLIDQHKESLAYVMTLEQGKPLEESRSEIDYANSFIKWFAEEGRRAYGDVVPANKSNQHIVVIKQAIGVVGAITPWNFPAAMVTRKVAPALACGCTVVLKPDSKTPLSALALAALAEKAGLPAGALNIVTGDHETIGAELTTNPLVRKLSFTGSTAVGRLLMQQCAPTLKKLSLELGGNAPFIVFADADIDQAVAGAIACKFRNSGQTCVCANRIFVQDKVYEAFSKKLAHAVKALKVGNGLEPGIQQGPLISQSALNKVQLHVEDAVSKGAQIVCGGKPHRLGGLFFEPTVLNNVNSSMRIAKEETFGPVAPLFCFQNEEEVVHMANDTEFGLASYFYSNDMSRIWRVAEHLAYGIVGINTGIISTEVAPFGGIKQSGMGREGSKYGLDDYLEIKYICMEGQAQFA